MKIFWPSRAAERTAQEAASIGRRLGCSFLALALLMAATAGLGAWWLARAGSAAQAGRLLAVGAAALLADFGLAWAAIRWIKRQIGCEPGHAVWAAKKIAQGNLAVDIEPGPHGAGSVLAAIASMRDSLAEIVRHARAGAEAVAQDSNSLAHVNLALSEKARLQAQGLARAVAALEELTQAVRLNGASIGRAHAMATAAADSAGEGGDAVARVVSTMSSISGSSAKVVDIIGVIDGIAFQTNLLALNAAVEAARAGEQGKGFAVVAGEVRSLARRSAEAAKQVEALIRQSAAQVSQGEKLVQEAGHRMRDIVGNVRQLSQAIADIDGQTHKQGVAIERIGGTMREIDAAVRDNAALVAQAAASAEAMQDQAGSLAQVVSVFKLRGGASSPAAAVGRMPDAPATASAVPSGFQPRLIRFGYGLATGSNQGRAARFFAQDLARRSGGRLKLKEFGDAALGNDDAMQEALVQGSLEMMVGSTATLVKYVPDFGAFDLPFVFADEAEADAVLDGRFGRQLADALEPHGIHGLVYWENGFRHLTNSRRPVERLEDLQGLRLRVMQNPVYIEMFSGFGAAAVPLPFAELFAAMETGAVDGQENPLNTIQSCRFYEVQKHLSLTRHVYSPWIVTASGRWWRSLSPEERAAVQASAQAARDFEREDSRRSAAQALDFLKAQGMAVTVVGDAELRRMRDQVRRALQASAQHGPQLRRIEEALARR